MQQQHTSVQTQLILPGFGPQALVLGLELAAALALVPCKVTAAQVIICMYADSLIHPTTLVEVMSLSGMSTYGVRQFLSSIKHSYKKDRTYKREQCTRRNAYGAFNLIQRTYCTIGGEISTGKRRASAKLSTLETSGQKVCA